MIFINTLHFVLPFRNVLTQTNFSFNTVASESLHSVFFRSPRWSHVAFTLSSRLVLAAHGRGELWALHSALVLQQSGGSVQTLHLQRLWRQQQPLPPPGGVWGALPWGGWRYSTTNPFRPSLFTNLTADFVCRSSRSTDGSVIVAVGPPPHRSVSLYMEFMWFCLFIVFFKPFSLNFALKKDSIILDFPQQIELLFLCKKSLFSSLRRVYFSVFTLMF